MTKRDGRICVFELLYEADFHKDTAANEIYSRAVRVRETETSKFTDSLYSLCRDNAEDIDSAIAAAAEGWTLSRMSCVTRALLRMAAGELLYTDVPAKVAINETLEISKIYNDKKSTSFINGILNKVARSAGKIQDGEKA